MDALTLANEVLTFDGDDTKHYRISDAYKDMTAFLQLDDGLESVVCFREYQLRYAICLVQIRCSSDPRLKPAKDIFDRMDRRHLPRFVACSRLNGSATWSSQTVADAVLKHASPNVRPEHLRVKVRASGNC